MKTRTLDWKNRPIKPLDGKKDQCGRCNLVLKQ